MQFHKIKPGGAAGVLTERLTKELTAKKRVLWLISGGSNIQVEVDVMRALPADLQAHLAILPSDERYGPFGHPNSNLQLLYDAGFAPGNATVIPILTPQQPSLDATIARYQAAAAATIDNADIIIALLGMGADGHVAGLLPNSSAINSRQLATGYEAVDFMRLTLTPRALKKVHTIYVVAFGTAKRQQLIKLRDKKLPIKSQPAQIIKQVPESHVYNDQIGGTT